MVKKMYSYSNQNQQFIEDKTGQNELGIHMIDLRCFQPIEMITERMNMFSFDNFASEKNPIQINGRTSEIIISITEMALFECI